MVALIASEQQHEKLENLRERLRQLPCAAITFSGGVDSTFLLHVAHEELGNRAFAITATSSLNPKRESEEARRFCEERGIFQVVVEHNPEEADGFCENPRNRCYICKLCLFSRLQEEAEEAARRMGVVGNHCVVPLLEGSNASDLLDYRPGRQAVQELGVLSPLESCDLSKQDIRDLSRELGLKTWEKPSFACLATRFVYGEPITNELLERVGDAEQIFVDAGFSQVRVRMHDKGDTARIEVEADRVFDALRFLSEGGSAKLHDLGYKHVSLDADGYRTGSMN